MHMPSSARRVALRGQSVIPLLFSTREAAEKIVRHLRDNDAARYDIELYFETPSDRA